ncbi:hypothetical protein ABEB36_010486 [Hypothenemus hampei]|uniref:Transcription factor CBF/NF-Y/archaeal histone domain-containing protein n=1 Tax=Hypothenemus hampei TaxID=57062 RepID=A0ABD1EJW5_HYPHA
MDESHKSTLKSIISVNRINTIMKSSSDVETVSRESSVIMSKATELFIRTFCLEGYTETNKGKKLDYKHLSNIVHRDDKYKFLRDIMPKKITLQQYNEIMARKQGQDENSDDENCSSIDDEESSSGEESEGSSSFSDN